MVARTWWALILFVSLASAVPSARAVEVLFDVSQVTTAPFPSNLFTTVDLRNLTNRRVALPKPDCAARPSDCADIDLLNGLDGFNAQPRLSIPFSGPIDVSSISSSSVFLVKLGDTAEPGSGFGEVVGINQIVWDGATNTLFAESDAFLEQHTTYALIVTDRVRAATGEPISAGPFRQFLRSDVRNARMALYRAELLAGIAAAKQPVSRVAAASVFTTQSVTATLEAIRNRIKLVVPSPATFSIVSDGTRAVFPLDTVAGVDFLVQFSTAPGFVNLPLSVELLNFIPSSVGTIAFGNYDSPNYLTADRLIKPVSTRFALPPLQGTNTVFFNLILPSGPRPANGWPVAIFAHGFADTKQSVFTLAASLASRGIATICINAVGHGGGSLGALIVQRKNMTTATLPAGGRSIDQNGDGFIDAAEGSLAANLSLIATRDGLRQTAVDLMQLVRVIESGGVDIDGDGRFDLDPQRIYQVGQAFGGFSGTLLAAVESGLRANVLNMVGGPTIEVVRLGVFRSAITPVLAARMPNLLNVEVIEPPLFGFNENAPLRNEPPRINDVPGAIALQNFIDVSEWITQSGNPVAYAPHLRAQPLRGVTPRPVIVQIAKGDQNTPNPTSTALIRAGGLADRTTYFRNDLAFTLDPRVPRDPTGFLTSIQNPAVAPAAIAAQKQIAIFFASDGAATIDPDGAAPLFETPIQELPEQTNFLPASHPTPGSDPGLSPPLPTPAPVPPTPFPAN